MPNIFGTGWMRRSASLFFRHNLKEDPHEDTLGTIYFDCELNNKPTTGNFVDALITVIVNSFACKGLTWCCQDAGAISLDNFTSFSCHLMLPHHVHPQDTIGRPPVMFYITKQAHSEWVIWRSFQCHVSDLITMQWQLVSACHLPLLPWRWR